MTDREEYAQGPDTGARVLKNGDKWTLVLVRELHHAPEKVWQALTDPKQLRQWAPFDVDGNMGTPGTVMLTWGGTPMAVETTVTRAEAPRLLEFNDIRWELEDLDGGTRLTLWHSIHRGYIAWGAAGWHICFEVLVQLLSGIAIAGMAGADAVKSKRWQQLRDGYARQFSVDEPSTPSKAAQGS